MTIHDHQHHIARHLPYFDGSYAWYQYLDDHSMPKQNVQNLPTKALSKLDQNREAARKCRLRKKVYVQKLESNQQNLIHLEQEIMRTRQQANSVRFGFSNDQSQPIGASCVVFDAECTQWENEHQRLIIDLRTVVNSHLGELCQIWIFQ